MPEWSANILDVWGDAGDPERARRLEEFALAVVGTDAQGKEHPLLLAAMYPDTDEWYGHTLTPAEATAWREKHWGTSQDTTDATCLFMPDESVRYEFSTPYTAPYDWVEYVSRWFPNLFLRLTYCMDWRTSAGWAVFYDGALVDQCSFGSDEWGDAVGAALAEVGAAHLWSGEVTAAQESDDQARTD